ncbi:MAG: hypothetical protein E6Q97_10200 [Desulfurellales bacterium]|nr:MAG: hypothetical protein E6Q97_10200 [Desulfurellales bacterium]
MPIETQNNNANVVLEVPLAAETEGFEPHRIMGVRLTVGAGRTLKQLYEAVSGVSTGSEPLTLSDGSPVTSLAETICWLLEQVEKNK